MLQRDLCNTVRLMFVSAAVVGMLPRALAAEVPLAERLGRLEQGLRAVRERLHTWSGSMRISQQLVVTNPLLAAVQVPADARLAGAAAKPMLPRPELRGDYVRFDDAEVGFVADGQTEDVWLHWQGTPAVFVGVEHNDKHEQSGPPLDCVSVLTPQTFLSLDRNSQVLAVEDPLRPGKSFPDEGRKRRRLAMRRPRQDAESYHEYAHIFNPVRMVNAATTESATRFAMYRELIAGGKNIEIEIDAVDGQPGGVYLTSRTYQGNPPLHVKTRYRELEPGLIVMESMKQYFEPVSKEPDNAQSWVWTKRDNVYTPVEYHIRHYDRERGRVRFLRTVEFSKDQVNQEIDRSAFTEAGLDLAIGDLLQNRPSGPVQVMTEDGLATSLPTLDEQPSRWSSLGLWIVIVLNTLVVALLIAYFFRRRAHATPRAS